MIFTFNYGAGKPVFIDKKGEVVLKHSHTRAFLASNSEGLVPFRDTNETTKNKYGSMIGFINLQGKVVIEPKYDFAGPIIGGISSVQIGDRKLYIDKQGKEIRPHKR